MCLLQVCLKWLTYLFQINISSDRIGWMNLKGQLILSFLSINLFGLLMTQYIGKKRKKVQKQGNLLPTYGTRVVPVYVSETERRHAQPSLAQRHILAGLASVVGGLRAPYEKASHIHGRPVVNWLWATGCLPFGPFSNISRINQLLYDVALRNTIYARVDSALHKIRETSEIIQAFTAEYLKTPLGEPVKGKKEKTTTELWLEKFYKKTTSLPEPFPHELVDRLEKYLDEQLVDLSSLLYDHRLQDAFLNSFRYCAEHYVHPTIRESCFGQ
ncbi:Transmembrane protein [Quillaja saponaria]|uniref:Transmembrane protein n=1 Tax=Quillaja saponaria TaxID=32244 RepID=A0AAD7LBU4_QUISA|nr:Transmembrane protein [Quillaja saponaria]